MVIELVIGGEFFTHLRDAVRFPADTARFFAAHVVLIFEHLHAKDIIYRDLKPENLLLDSDGFLKITDFGFAKKVSFRTYTLCGTPEYIAPEVSRLFSLDARAAFCSNPVVGLCDARKVLLNVGHGKGVDWWTLGILLYEMLHGDPPFVDEDPLCIYQQILNGKVRFPRAYDKAAKSLTKKLLSSDLTRRFGCLKLGVVDIKMSKFFANFPWDQLLSRSLEPPIVPELSSPDDTSLFEDYPEEEEDATPPEYGCRTGLPVTLMHAPVASPISHMLKLPELPAP